MARNPCKENGNKLGIYAESWCGEYCQGKPQFTCDVDGNCVVYHCVKVQNFKSYEMDVIVSGKIDNSSYIKFKPKTPHDTDVYWEDSVSGIQDGQECIFDHIEICSSKGPNNSQRVETSIFAEWTDSGHKEDFSFLFPVKPI